MNLEAPYRQEIRILEPRVLVDGRGHVMEMWSERSLRQAGIDLVIRAETLARSSRGVVRGLHHQIERPQARLVRVLSGAIFAVAVDVRRSSPAFGAATCVELNDENRRAVFVPEGFSFGFMGLSGFSDVLICASEAHEPRDEHILMWNDPAFGIEWLDVGPVVLSRSDQSGRSLQDVETLD